MDKKALAEYCRYMVDYTEFFEQMVDGEQEKLDALLSYDLKRVEQSISIQLADQKKFEQMEEQRMELQVRAGFQKNSTFEEIVEGTEGEYQQQLAEIFEWLSELVDEVKYYNSKSLDLVKMNLKAIGTKLPPEERQDLNAYSPESLRGEAWGSGSSAFQAKI